MSLQITKTDEAMHYGIYIRVPSEDQIQTAIDNMVRIKMPCGNDISLAQVENRVYEDPCPCGNPAHILVKVAVDPSINQQ